MEEINWVGEHLSALTVLKKYSFNLPPIMRIYNQENPNNLFVQFEFIQNKDKKSLTLTFYPKGIDNNGMSFDVLVSNNNKSINLSSFLAYLATKKPVSIQNISEQKFQIDPDESNWRESLLNLLNTINQSLDDHAVVLLSGNKIPEIPIEDPRDKY